MIPEPQLTDTLLELHEYWKRFPALKGTKMKANEGTFRKELLSELNRRIGVKFVAVPTTGLYHSGKGTPDLLGCFCGRMVWIECKMGNNVPTDMQRFTMDLWTGAGAAVFWMSKEPNSYMVYPINPRRTAAIPTRFGSLPDAANFVLSLCHRA